MTNPTDTRTEAQRIAAAYNFWKDNSHAGLLMQTIQYSYLIREIRSNNSDPYIHELIEAHLAEVAR